MKQLLPGQSTLFFEAAKHFLDWRQHHFFTAKCRSNCGALLLNARWQNNHDDIWLGLAVCERLKFGDNQVHDLLQFRGDLGAFDSFGKIRFRDDTLDCRLRYKVQPKTCRRIRTRKIKEADRGRRASLLNLGLG